MEHVTRRRAAVGWSESVEAGLVAGLLGGMCMALVAMLHSSSTGLGFWLPVNVIAGVFFGAEALLGGASVIVVGLIAHLATAAAWGLLFAMLVRGRLRGPEATASGLVYGALVWAVMSYLVLPWANPTMFSRVNVAMEWFFVYHMVYGATLALTPALARSFHGRRGGTAHRAPVPA